MSNKNLEKNAYRSHVISWSKNYGNMIQDISQGILAFIPNGLSLLYDSVLKTLPLCGGFFSRRWVEQTCKLLSGITLCQSLAADIAHFVFWPIGFIFGMLMANVTPRVKAPNYHGQVGKWLYHVCAQTLSGAAIAPFSLWIFSGLLTEWFNVIPRLKHYIVISILGALIGLLAKTLFLLAIHAVQATSAATIRKNVQNAKALSTKLKKIAKQKARGHILTQAQDIIQQMNGAQSLQHLEVFFKEKYDVISVNIHKKLERHFDYLTDRACHGDLKALHRLQELLPNPSPNAALETKKTKLDLMLDRIFNARAIAKIKDDVDTTFDRWQYGFLRTAES